MKHSILLKVVLSVLCLVSRGICDEGYKIVFNDGLANCDGFTNDVFDADNMDLGKPEDDGDSMYLQGYIVANKAIDKGTFIDLEVVKETEIGSEPMWGCTMDFCESLDDDDSPWAEGVRAMNITGCPISTGKYIAKALMLNMGFANDFMNHNYCGSYGVGLKLLDNQRNVLSCHVLAIAIKEDDDRK